MAGPDLSALHPTGCCASQELHSASGQAQHSPAHPMPFSPWAALAGGVGAVCMRVRVCVSVCGWWGWVCVCAAPVRSGGTVETKWTWCPTLLVPTPLYPLPYWSNRSTDDAIAFALNTLF